MPPIEVRRAGEAQAPALAAALARAFHDEADFAFMLPDPAARPRALAWFFRDVALPYGRLYGAVYATKESDGAAIWLRPGPPLTWRQAARTGALWAPLHFGWRGSRRLQAVDRALDAARRQHAPARHWYLMILGVAPERQGRGVGSALLAPGLAAADREGAACYLETFNPALASFYGRHGFEPACAATVPGGPPFVGMVRKSKDEG